MDSDTKLVLLPTPTSRSTIPSSRETPTRPLLHGENPHPPTRSNHPHVVQEQYWHDLDGKPQELGGQSRRDPSASLPERLGSRSLSDRPRYTNNTDSSLQMFGLDYNRESGYEEGNDASFGPFVRSTQQAIDRARSPPVRQSPSTRGLLPSIFSSTRASESLSRREQNHSFHAGQESLDREKQRLGRLHDHRIVVAPSTRASESLSCTEQIRLLHAGQESLDRGEQRLTRLQDHRLVVGPEHDPLRQMPKVAANSTEQVRREPGLIETETPLRASRQDVDSAPSIWRASIAQFLSKLTLQERPINEDREKGSSSDTAANAPSSAADGGIFDNQNSKESHFLVRGLSEDAEALLISSQSPVATFIEARTGLECRRPDIRSSDDGVEDELPARGSQAGSQEALGSTSTENEPDGQEHGRLGSKRQRVDNNNARVDNANEGRSHETVKTKRKRPGSNGEQLLICCFRSDSQNPCVGTDKSICEVIDRLANCHHIFVCKACYVLLVEDDSGEIVHPNDVDCVEHCLSPRCLGDSIATAGQKHHFDAKSCRTKTGRPRPGDRETIYRYIFKLVHPTKETPANVFTTRRAPHLGVIPRQGNRKPTRDELESRIRGVNEQFGELHERDTASLKQIDVLKRNLKTERTANSNLAEKIQRLQDIIADAIRPGALDDDHWRRSILQRVKRDAPSALDHDWTHAQTHQTPPESLHDTSQRSSTMPAPGEAGLTGQDQSSRDISLQPLSNNTTRYEPPSIAHGDFLAGFTTRMQNRSPFTQFNPGTMRNATLCLPFGPSLTNATENALPQDLSGSLGHWRQDIPSGGPVFSHHLTNTDTQTGARPDLPSNFLEDRVWAGDCLGGGLFPDDGAGMMAGPSSDWCGQDIDNTPLMEQTPVSVQVPHQPHRQSQPHYQQFGPWVGRSAD